MDLHRRANKGNTFTHLQQKMLSPDEAVQELVNHNNRIMRSPTKKELKAISRLTAAVDVAKTENRDGMVEHIVDLVNDLDVVFFGGFLSAHIEVVWGDPTDFMNHGHFDVGGTLG